MQRVYFKDLPILTEAADEDTLLARDASEDKVGVFSIATLRAAMGGGSPDRIESASGEAFVETTDDMFGMGNPGSLVRTNHSSGSAFAYTAIAPGEGGPSHPVLMTSIAVANADETQSAGIVAQYDSTTEEFMLNATGAPLTIETPVKPDHAATKGYVDARPGAEKWSEHAATQDVDLDGHKLTGLGEPTDAADAATKGYVDGLPPPDEMRVDWGTYGSTLIEFPFSGASRGIRLLRDSQYRLNPLLHGEITEILIAPNGHGLSMRKEDAGGNPLGAKIELNSTGSNAVIIEGYGGANVSNRGRLVLSTGFWSFSSRGGPPIYVSNSAYPDMPEGVDAFTHAAHLAKEAYDTLASMPAPPDLEWWDPVWTPVSNVDSASNVECSYTRTYRAAGGSLVTLEGTIEVTPEASGQCAVQVDLPIARVGSGLLAGTALAMEVTPPGHVVAVASVAETTLTLGFVAEGVDPYLVGFRISYRAA